MNRILALALVTIVSFGFSGTGMAREATIVVKGSSWDSDSRGFANIAGLSAFVAYECGEVPIGDAHTRFNFQYYVFALVFVVFDVLSSFLLAWALAIKEIKLAGMISAGAFLSILAIGFLYWWKRNALQWM